MNINCKLNLLISLVVTLTVWVSGIDVRAVENKITLAAQNNAWISKEAYELASDLDIAQNIENIHEHQLKVFKLPGQSLDLKTLTLRENILETLFIASLEINNVIAKIDEEITLDHELVQYINSKRGKSAELANITNLVSTGALAIIGSAIQIGTARPTINAGSEIKVVAGGVASTLSAYALLQQKSGKAKQSCKPNMLTQIFYGKCNNENVTYPRFVWRYLNGGVKLLECHQKSRREVLIQRWVNYNKILPLTSSQSKQQIAMLTGTQLGYYSMSINDLEKRANMLADLRAQIALMNHNLLELMQDIKAR